MAQPSEPERLLLEQNTVAIANVDTRRLTRLIREKGAMGGCIVAGEAAEHDNATAEALAQAQGFQGLAGADLAQKLQVCSVRGPKHPGILALATGGD
ncbi:MAG: hypothetical protein CM15mP120_23590 [Pseudomonadota bacterium]|nr:MAG: hypothetical protein CM15mP120_23590 [Pseudomonadota bacterium]